MEALPLVLTTIVYQSVPGQDGSLLVFFAHSCSDGGKCERRNWGRSQMRQGSFLADLMDLD